MGNHNSHGNHKSRKNSPNGSATDIPSKKAVSRTVSGSETHEKAHTKHESLQKLAKILSSKAQKEEGVNGITRNVFAKYLFPRYPHLSEKLFKYLHALSQSKTSYIGTNAFMQQCDKFLQILDESILSDIIVKMFAELKEESDIITPEAMKDLLMSAYHISMDHYSEGPQMCLSISRTLKAVTDSCFHGKDTLSSSYVSHWLQANCPRLLQPLHRYIVHSLATSYRNLQETDNPNLAAGLELATPVLDKAPPFPPGKLPHPRLLTMSLSWLLASALPPIYSQPRKANSPNNGQNGLNGLASVMFLSKMLSSIPSHWVLLYDSDEQGLGSNRFLHHVMNYKGPTLVLFKTNESDLFCIAAPDEWRESHQYWGSEDARLYQLVPKFAMLEAGKKSLYLNFSARGYPHGLRMGVDPRAPMISVDAGFENIEYKKIPYKLHTIEVWGCGDAVSRDRQLEVKKWEVKEVERQRAVKMSAAEWLDHPDRYLLELAGRPQYNNGK